MDGPTYARFHQLQSRRPIVPFRHNARVAGQRRYSILSLEFGKWAGEISKAELPDHFYVDYVRVYKEVAAKPKKMWSSCHSARPGFRILSLSLKAITHLFPIHKFIKDFNTLQPI
ncbi:MAG: hypothetical protein JXA81_03885 [Sedimentisphaerales bacterium]|nr:hypothetical protein [Sedimentisphaerales bacterium]